MSSTIVETVWPEAGREAKSAFEHSFSNLVALPANYQAIEIGMLFALGLTPLAAFVGPTGWGKSHLLASVAARIGPGASPLSLHSFLRHPHRFESARVLILDDVHEAIGKTRCRQELSMHLERRVRSGKHTAVAITSSSASRAIRGLLPAVRDWTVCSLAAPAKEERVLLVGQMAAQHGLRLSPQLERIMGHKMGGNGNTLRGALQCLRLSGFTWSSPSETLRACAVLDPFFADNPDWDLRIKIRRMAAKSASSYGFDPLDIALYTSLCVAGLAELDTARSAGIEPCEAYARANRLHAKLKHDSARAAACDDFLVNVVESLA